MNILSTIWGIITLLLAFVAFLPLMGWANWFLIILAIIGAVLGAFSRKRTGLWLNLIALALCTARLMLGGGVF